MKTVTIAIVGNPNCGKTTLFNALTGARQYTGNWSGVTVERKEGGFVHDGQAVRVVDLPGVYSLSPAMDLDSLDEKIARDYVLSDEADLVVNIVDATNLERNLYLTAQLVEMRVPLVVALNMMDAARRQGLDVDLDVLSARLGCPVVPLVASRAQGLDALKAEIGCSAHPRPTAVLPYAKALEAAVAELLPQAEALAAPAGVDGRWLAVRLLEGDDLARNLAKGAADESLPGLIARIEDEAGEEPDILIADGRYGFAHQLAATCLRHTRRISRPISDAVDRVVLHPLIGLPIFLGVMYVMFMFTIRLGGAFIDFFDVLGETLFVKGFGHLLLAIGAPQWVKAVLADGVGGGVQVVGTFIPIIGFMYLFLSVLEDSGYMARAAFLMDRFMRRFGLPGKSFVPLIVGFGCNVPAVMATRALESPRHRLITVAMAPFMSCGARLAVYALFVAAFFPENGQNLVFALYLIGVAAAILTGFLLQSTVLKGENTPFMMELPAYHLPSLRSVVIHSWTRMKSFVLGAGKIIVLVVAVLGFFNTLGLDGSFGNQNNGRSVLATIGRAIVPAFAPMGIHPDNWPATVGIFSGVFAKEAIVGTLNTLYTGLDGANAQAAAQPFDLATGVKAAFATIPADLGKLAGQLGNPLGLNVGGTGAQAAAAQGVDQRTFGTMAERFDGRLGALAYLLFILLYTPCVATMGAILREAGWRWTAFIVAWTTGVAWAASVAVYQAGSFARHPASSSLWLGGLALASAAAVLGLWRQGRRSRRLNPAASSTTPLAEGQA